MSPNLATVTAVLGYLSKLVLAFFICFTGFIGVSIGYNFLHKALNESSEILVIFLFYLAILLVIAASYKVMMSNKPFYSTDLPYNSDKDLQLNERLK